MGLRVRLFTAGLALFAASTVTPAHAASAPAPVEVALAAAETLRAAEEDGEVCISIPRWTSGSCDAPDDGVVTVSGVPGGVKLVGVAVPAAAVSIEVRRGGVLLASEATVAGAAYRGAGAGSLRFTLVRLADTALLDGLRIHALDASGTLVTVLAEQDSELFTDRRRLLSGRSAGIRWSLTTSRQSTLSPSVLDLARETVSQCVRTNAQFGDLTFSTTSCASGPPQSGLELNEHEESAVEDRCTGSRLLHGVVAGPARVSLVLGDGRRRAVRSVAVGDGWQAYAVTTGAEAVRAVMLTTPTGAVRVLRRGLSPLTTQCAAGEASFESGSTADSPFDEWSVVSPATPPVALAGPPAFRVADGPGDALCLAIGNLPFRAAGCGIASPSLGALNGVLDSFTDPAAVALAVPARVASVRVPTPDGKGALSIPTDPGADYTGRYAGHVRFAAVSFARLSQLSRIELLDAAGTVLMRGVELGGAEELLELGEGSLRFARPRRVAGRSGAPSLWKTTARFEGLTGRCFAMTDGAAPTGDARCPYASDDAAILLDASCVPRRLSVAVVTRPGTRAFADVGLPKPRRLRLRNGIGLLTLPAARPLRTLTFIDKGRVRRVRINAPAAARECGWSAAREIAPS